MFNLLGDPTGAGWALMWNDEFNGSNLNTAKWGYGSLPWGGQHHNWGYTNYIMADDSYVTNGFLVCRAQHRDVSGNDNAGKSTMFHYTSGYAHSNGKFRYTFGYMEARIRFPGGRGVWPAWWTLSDGWPPEFDIAEYFGADDRMHMGLYRNISTGGTATNQWTSANFYSESFTNWHTYALEWGPDYAIWYKDGVQKKRIDESFVPDSGMYIIFNNGVQNISSVSATFPNYMEVDYVRVFKRAEIVMNGDFEGGNNYWSRRNGAAVVSAEGRDGGKALKIQTTGTGDGAGEQTIYGLDPNTPYLLSGWVRSPSSWPATRLGVKSFGGADTNAANGNSSWRQLNVKFTTGLNYTQATIYAWFPEAWGTTYTDDIQVRRVAAVNNAGFETRYFDPHWQKQSNAWILQYSAHSGDSALQMHSGASAWQELAGLTTNTTYKLKAWIIGPTWPGLRIGVTNYGGNEVYLNAAGPTGSTYGPATLTFTTGSNNTTAAFYALSPTPGYDTVYFLDDLFLYEPLAVPWVSGSVGNVVLVGEGGRRETNYVLQGAGGDIWGTNDAFHFVYRTLTNDGTLTARIRALDSTNASAKVGITLRESVSAGARHVLLDWMPQQKVEQILRIASNGPSSAVWVNGVSNAPWVRLVRATNLFTSYYSTDGTNWVAVATNTVSMAANLLAGLVVCSHNTNVLAEATLDNVALVPVDANFNGIPDDWEMANLGSLTNATVVSDADADGFTDLQEWQLGLDPKVKTPVILTNAARPTAGQFVFEFYGAPGMTNAVESSFDLIGGTWSNMAPEILVSNPSNKLGATGLILHRYTMPVTTNQSGFMRVRVK